MPDVLMVLFEVLPDGNQQVVSSQTFGSREEALNKFDEMTRSIFVGPGCHNYQLDLVDRASIHDFVDFYTSNEYGDTVWAKWQALKTGDIAEANLGGDFTNSHPVDNDCSVPIPVTPPLTDFHPTPVPDSPAVPLSTASVEAPDPTPAPLPAPAPNYAATALVAASPAAPELAMTGGNPGPLAAASGGLLALGVILAWCSRRLSTRNP